MSSEAISRQFPSIAKDLPAFALQPAGFGHYETYIHGCHEGLKTVGLMPLQDGRIFAPIGAYLQLYGRPRTGKSPKKNNSENHDRDRDIVLVWALDPERLKPQPVSITPYEISKYKLPESALNKVLGPRLQEGHGDIFVVDVQKKLSPERTLESVIHTDQRILRELHIRYGMIAMITPTLWGNDSILYRFRKCEGETNAQGEQLYRLLTTLAPTRGFNLAEVCLEHTKGDSECAFMDGASLCTEEKMTIEQCQKAMMADAAKRAPRVVADQSPYELENIEKEPFYTLYDAAGNASREYKKPVPSLIARFYPLRKLQEAYGYAEKMKADNFRKMMHLKVAYAFKHLDFKEIASTVFSVLTVNALIAVTSWVLFSVLSPMFLLMTRVSTQSLHRIGHQFVHGMHRGPETYAPGRERLLRKFCKDWSPRKIRALLDPKWRLFLGVRNYLSLNSGIGAGKGLHDVLPRNWAISKAIAGSIQDPPASFVMPMNLNQHTGIHVVGSGGQNISYISSLDITIARMDWERVPMETIHKLIPDAVIDVHREASAEKPFLYIRYERGSRVPHWKFISWAEQDAELKSIREMPNTAPAPFPDALPDFEEPAPSSPASRLSKLMAKFGSVGGPTVVDRGMEEANVTAEGFHRPSRIPHIGGGLHIPH